MLKSNATDGVLRKKIVVLRSFISECTLCTLKSNVTKQNVTKPNVATTGTKPRKYKGIKQDPAPSYRVQNVGKCWSKYGVGMLRNDKVKFGCKMQLPGLWYFDIIALEHIEQSTTTAEWQV